MHNKWLPMTGIDGPQPGFRAPEIIDRIKHTKYSLHSDARMTHLRLGKNCAQLKENICMMQWMSLTNNWSMLGVQAALMMQVAGTWQPRLTYLCRSGSNGFLKKAHSMFPVLTDQHSQIFFWLVWHWNREWGWYLFTFRHTNGTMNVSSHYKASTGHALDLVQACTRSNVSVCLLDFQLDLAWLGQLFSPQTAVVAPTTGYEWGFSTKTPADGIKQLDGEH